MARNQLVWTGTVETTAPDEINKEIERYVDTVSTPSKVGISWQHNFPLKKGGTDLSATSAAAIVGSLQMNF
jgi:hypothetical protein